MEPIRILIVDDHPLVRMGLHTLLDTTPGLQVIGEAVDGAEGVAQALALRPDVILMDLVMPNLSGIDAISAIKKQNPKARILVLTSFDEDGKVFPAIKAGALGYLLKDSSPEELLRAIHDVHGGKPSLDPDIALKLIHEIHHPADLPPTEEPLTEREAEVLVGVARGLTNRQISQDLVISERTVSTHISSILNKLHLANRTQAALYAQQKGMTVP